VEFFARRFAGVFVGRQRGVFQHPDDRRTPQFSAVKLSAMASRSAWVGGAAASNGVNDLRTAPHGRHDEARAIRPVSVCCYLRSNLSACSM
jgi:hypothetical protein